ncbi:TIGR03067 domain-containing protein [Telmatocola sphagniphila]|uniref:TIGR03067 domain-containing protein n=1 Tax=Telmatocola sphagniphila TaxID=1123043 RepID=A0A8E6B4Y2_9BACT|nr:TIGR03067 domain-containing protein [Telmatocola sphagniphila]QVL31514.1 TIGR03067 domain-containing protein [Telmatocola sphagniphila]
MKRVMYLLFFVFLFDLIGCSPEPLVQSNRRQTQQEKKESEASIIGKWELVKCVFKGKEAPSNLLRDVEVIIDTEKISFKPAIISSTGRNKEKTEFRLEGSFKAKLKFDPYHSPHSNLDLTVEEDGESNLLKGIYKLDVNNLKICVSPTSERPKDFSSTDSSDTRLLELKRKTDQ